MNEKPVVLAVDDRPENLLTIEAVLQPLDVRLEKALRAETALQFLLENDVSVILLDVEMPNVDGFETARLIRQRPRSQSTPIIFITGVECGDATVREGYELGAVEYLVKPFQPDILGWKVSVLAEFYRSRQRERLFIEEKTRRIEMEAAARRAILASDWALQLLAGWRNYMEVRFAWKAVDKDLEALLLLPFPPDRCKFVQVSAVLQIDCN